MSIQRVQDVSLTQVPNLDWTILRRADKVATIRVESDTLDSFLVQVAISEIWASFLGMSIVVLNAALRTNIPDLDSLIIEGTSNTSTIWVEFDTIDLGWMIREITNVLSCAQFKQLNMFVLGARDNEPGIRGELGRVNPIIVSINIPQELTILQIEALESLIVRTGQNHTSITRERHSLHSSRMRLNNL